MLQDRFASSGQSSNHLATSAGHQPISSSPSPRPSLNTTPRRAVQGLLTLTRRAHAREGQTPPSPTALRRIAPPEVLDRAPQAGSRGPARVRVPSGAEAGRGAGGFPPPGGLGPIGRAGGPRQTSNRGI